MPEQRAPAASLQDYLGYLTTSTALCLALALPLAAGAAAGRCRRGTSLRSLWLFGLVPLIGFVGHTAVEPALTGTGAPALRSVAPLALVGLLIQTSFALSAIALARRVITLVEGLAHVLATPALLHAPRPSTTALRPRARRAPVFTLGFVHTGRGPPLLAA